MIDDCVSARRSKAESEEAKEALASFISRQIPGALKKAREFFYVEGKPYGRGGKLWYIRTNPEFRKEDLRFLATTDLVQMRAFLRGYEKGKRA